MWLCSIFNYSCTQQKGLKNTCVNIHKWFPRASGHRSSRTMQWAILPACPSRVCIRSIWSENLQHMGLSGNGIYLQNGIWMCWNGENDYQSISIMGFGGFPNFFGYPTQTQRNKTAKLPVEELTRRHLPTSQRFHGPQGRDVELIPLAGQESSGAS